MKTYLNQGVKPIIEQFPIVGEILDKFGIGCTTCTAGSCLLKDVVGIHNLPAETEAELMYRLEKALYPDRKVVKPKVRQEQVLPKVIKFSPPLQELVDEHQLIKRWIRLVPAVIAYFKQDEAQVWQWIRDGIAFSQNYADSFHHAKEEDILFEYADQSHDVIRAMYEDHKQGRAHVQAVLAAVGQKDQGTAAFHLKAYGDLLVEHIKKEDEILYPWIDRNLSMTQVGEMYGQFHEVNQKFVVSQYEDFVKQVEDVLRQML